MPPLPLAPEVMRRWGIRHDAARGVLLLAPRVVSGEREAACPPFRADRSVVQVSLRRRPATLALRVAVTFGPALRIEAEPTGIAVEGTALVDGVAVVGPAVAFEARAEHEVIWMTA